jgi:hypothetical protein
MDSGWSTVAGHPIPAYRLLGDGNVQLHGYASHASFTSATNLQGSSNLPSLYRPANTVYPRGGDANRSGVEVSSAGTITAEPVSGGSTQIELTGIIFPAGL